MKSLLKKCLPRQTIEQLKTLKESAVLGALNWFAKSQRRSSFYYAFFSTSFGREHQAVLQGRLTYHLTHRKLESSSSALLRRNIHRLEKGLIMQPRKATFAENYIDETVNAFSQICQSNLFCGEERKWATDVLTDYFDVVAETPVIRKAKCLFREQSAVGNGEYVPYTDEKRTRTDISVENLENLFKQRRSTRWFIQQEVESNKIDRAITMASLAPSACNRQPYNFYVARDTEKAQDLAMLAMGTGGFAHNIPCMIAVVGELAAYPYERDRHLIYIDGSLAAMQLMLALETLGLSSCPLNWPDIEVREQAIAKHLSLHEHQRVIMLIAVGYADPKGMIPYSQKKTATALRVDIE